MYSELLETDGALRVAGILELRLHKVMTFLILLPKLPMCMTKVFNSMKISEIIYCKSMSRIYEQVSDKY